MSSSPLSLDDFHTAEGRIRSYVRKTPLAHNHSLSRRFDFPVYLKLENWQRTGAFKARGAFNKLLALSARQRQEGVLTASAGNHGLGVAHASALLQIPARIVVPENASRAKIRALESFKVELIKSGDDYDAAQQFAENLQNREGGTFVHAFSDLEIIAGQGTIALEIIEELPDVQTILVPIGGGGLISGIAAAAKALNPSVKIIGIQSEASPAMYKSLKAGRVVETPIEETIADGLAGRFVTDLTLNLTKRYVDEVFLVSEESIKRAMKLILETEHMVIEGSAAVGIAALLENKCPLTGNTVCVITGRNIDTALLKELL